MVDMKEFPEGILFRYSWRKYQKQFLDNLQDYLSDNHLHIVAPPGSGKTVLGLEIMLRINNPTLIVAPTLAIRNQWAQRFRELFLQSDTLPEWISFDLNKPAFVTLATYQGIHSVIKRDAESKTVEKKLNNDSFLKLIKKLKIGTLILDEAHHLKNAWWQSIIAIKDQLNPIVVALTATQPFDVSESEWQNYIELNGPVDAEISVPELMLEGDLCPHQDLIYFTLPTLEEKLSIDQIYQYADNLYKEIKQDSVIIEAIVNHYIYKDPEKHLEWIYDNVSSYTSGLIFMNAIGIKIADIHFQIIGDEQKYIPEFDFFWLEELLEFYLFTDDIHFKKYEDSRQAVANRLKRNSILKNKTISFFQNEKLEHILNAGSGKLEAIRNITISESENFGNDLRMVILTDFIRKEFIANDIEPTPSPDKMGVAPIFEILKNDPLVGKDIGVLTGSLVILPRELANQLVKDFPDKDVSLSEMKSDGNFVQIYPKDNNQSFLVEIVTHFFQEGRINILIGTKSLLGEGWDAPKINSLIVASFVSSYVLSNQIRGRAIRTDKDNPEKVSNIWHLICFNERDPEGGMDYQKMVKRFKTFVGVSNRENEQIENNIERLNIKTIEKISEIEEINKEMISLACRKNELKDKWNRALKKGDHLVEEIQIESQVRINGRKRNLKALVKVLATLWEC